MLCLLRYDVSNDLGVLDVVLAAHERPHDFQKLLVEHVVEEAVRSNDQDIIVLHIVQLCFSFLRVVTSGTDLEWEVEAMGLLL